MTDVEQLRTAVEELVEVLHRQAEEMQRLLAHIEGQTTRAPYPNQIPLILSELSELHNRIKKLKAGEPAVRPARPAGRPAR